MGNGNSAHGRGGSIEADGGWSMIQASGSSGGSGERGERKFDMATLLVRLVSELTPGTRSGFISFFASVDLAIGTMRTAVRRTSSS